ncbi:alpha-(1,3)-fucosyltransferase C, partial [Biomphalaria glabrata]
MAINRAVAMSVPGKQLFLYLGVLCIFCLIIQEIYQTTQAYKRRLNHVTTSIDASKELNQNRGDETGRQNTGDETEDQDTDDETEGQDTGDETEDQDTGDETEGQDTGDETEDQDTEDETEGQDTEDETEDQDTEDETEGQDTEDETEGQNTEDETEGQDTGDETEGQDTGDETEGQDTGHETKGPDTEDETENQDTEDETEDQVTGHETGGYTNSNLISGNKRENVRIKNNNSLILINNYAQSSTPNVNQSSTAQSDEDYEISAAENYNDPYRVEKLRLSQSPYIYNEDVEKERIKKSKSQTTVLSVFAAVEGVSRQGFQMCAYDHCQFVDNITRADAVIFSASYIRGNRMPEYNRTSNQRWLMYTYDPAVKTYGLARDDVGSKFNLTLTYQLDASYPLVFGQLRRRKLPEKDYDKIYKGKTNHTAWFVSHCITWSKREIYVKRMRKLIPVDIYGGCSDRKCGVIHYRTSDNSLCLPMLSKQYKFYLAFENSFCKDYISEKFFKLFQEVDVIPVVRGGFDYKKYLPSGIFVDAADFKTPEDLAKYLLQLGSNQKEYVKMLKRKN